MTLNSLLKMLRTSLRWRRPVSKQNEASISDAPPPVLLAATGATQASVPSRAGKEKRSRQLSPIYRLPPEILSMVFIHTLLATDDWHGDKRVYKVPLVLMLVCTHWKAVALDTREIWSSISCSLRRSMNDMESDAVDKAVAWLERSGSHPLTIQLVAPPPTRAPSVDIPVSFYTQSSRWQHVYFHAEMSSIHDLTSVKGKLPSLKMLGLDVYRSRGSPIVPLEDIFADAPRLRQLVLGPLFLAYYKPDLFNIPWAQLTRCMMPIANQCMPVIHQMRNLVQLTATLTFVGGSRVTAGSRATFPCMRALAIRIDSFRPRHPDSADIGQFLDRLATPALESLSIRSPSEDGPACGSQLVAFLSRTGNSVEEMSLENVHVPDEDLAFCIQMTPSLVSLELADSTQAPGRTNLNILLDHLAWPGVRGDGPLVPNLGYMRTRGIYNLYNVYKFNEAMKLRDVKISRFQKSSVARR